VKYSLLVLSELLSMERAAKLLKRAVDFIHDRCILGLLLEGPAAWDTLTRANSDAPSTADRNTLATHQIATLIVLMTQTFRFSQLRLQVLLHTVCVVCQSCLGSSGTVCHVMCSDGASQHLHVNIRKYHGHSCSEDITGPHVYTNGVFFVLT
jgi:hypothetical protein